MAERDDHSRETWITGIGIVSCLGEGLDAHWQGLNAAPPAADATSFAPYIVHRIVPLEFDKQIPKKGDQRQMEPWQRIGTYAAGLALDSAGVKGKAGIPLAHGHDRRGRRRRARRAGRPQRGGECRQGRKGARPSSTSG